MVKPSMPLRCYLETVWVPIIYVLDPAIASISFVCIFEETVFKLVFSNCIFMLVLCAGLPKKCWIY